MARRIVSVRSKVFINNAQIAALNLPSGEIGMWADRQIEVAQEAARAAIVAKPPAPQGPWIRTGNLAASVDGDRKGSNQNGINFRLDADASYALYVHEGTAARITAGGGWMPVGVPGRSQGSLHSSGFATYSREVSGQEGYPFLRMGLNTMLVRNQLRPARG